MEAAKSDLHRTDDTSKGLEIVQYVDCTRLALDNSIYVVATSKVHGAFKGTADFDCLQYLIAKWYANILGWEISCVVMSCNIKVDTQKVRI